jgi:hypothetical protein
MAGHYSHPGMFAGSSHHLWKKLGLENSCRRL